MQAIMHPAHNLVDLYVLQGERCLNIINFHDNLDKRPSFWKSEKSARNEQVKRKANFIEHEVEPLRRLIEQGEHSLQLGLDRNKFNQYLQNHMPEEYQKVAIKNDISLVDFFDHDYPENLKHSLRDEFINENLANAKQEPYLIAKNIIQFHNKEIGVEKLQDLLPTANQNAFTR